MPVKKYRVDKPKGAKHGWWSEKQRMEAFTLYLTLGSLVLVSEKLGIPAKTLVKWKASDWWKNELTEFENGNKVKLGTKVSNLLSKASVSLEDMLDNGNMYYDFKTKSIARKPLTAREVVEIMRVGVQTSDMVEKARMAYEERDQRTQKAQEQIEKLERIAKMLTNKQVNEAPALIDLEPNPETGVFENESIKDAEEFINAEELINAEQPQL
jgi:uncharacterized protein YjcR